MSHKGKDRGGGPEVDVDFDFFDTPRDTSKEEKLGKTKSKIEEPSPSTSKSHNTHGHGHGGKQSRKPYAPCSGSSESEADSGSDSELPTRKSNVKIAARVPTATNDEDNYYDDSFESDSDHDDDLKNSGRRAPTPMSGRKGRKRTGSSDSDRSESKNASQKHQAWGEDTLGKHKNENRHSKPSGKSQNGRRSRSTSRDRHRRRHSSHGSDYSTDSTTDWSSDDSDVTDVSPLHSPHTTGKYSGRAHGKPPKSPSFKEKGSSSASGNPQSSRLERLLHANRDTMDLKLLMQAVLEMEQQEQRQPQKTRKQFSVPPPAGPLPQNRRNFSFSNDRTGTIDKENQRLMQQIIKNAVQAKQAKQKPKRQITPTYNSKVTSSAINRQREQERIEAENRAMLRRLQGTRATRPVQRDKQLREYNKQMLFGVSVAAAHSSLGKKTPYDTSSRSNPRAQSAAAWHSNPGDMTPNKYGRTRPQSAKAALGGGQPAGVTRSRPISATTGSRSRPTSATYAGVSSPSGAKKRRPQSGKMNKHDATFTKSDELVDWEAGW